MTERISNVRDVSRLIKAHRQLEGGGFVVRRPFPNPGLSHIDPFLLIDEMGPVDYAPGEAIGAPDHPHRGFETVTYVLEGETEHEDSAGHRGAIRAGGVQWMTAGAGIVHSEMPSRALRERGGRMHGFQIWVNLPARLKMTRPRYQEIASEDIPEATSADGRVQVRVIAGEALGARARLATLTPVVYQDYRVEPGGDVTLELAPELRGLVYVFDGALAIGPEERRVVSGELAVLGPGDGVRLRAPSNATETGRALLLAGAPIGEPVARYGPFVMNSRQELEQAFRDYQSGRMGEITRTAEVHSPV